MTTINSENGCMGRSIPPSDDPHVGQIRDLIYQASGIFISETRFRFLDERCRRRMEAVPSKSLLEYFRYLTSHPGRAAEMRCLLNEITIGETCFFRNQAQLDALQSFILPGIAAAKSGQGLQHVRIWSAGCSTGEEPYTLAILLLENSAGLLKDWTFEIIATDLNENSISKAQEGVYGDYALRNVKRYYLDKYFERHGDLYQLNRDVRSRVRF